MRSAALLLALAAACASTQLAPLRSSNDALDDDERALWSEAQKQEQRFSKTGVLYGDAALDASLDAVAARLAGADGVSMVFHVRAVKSPYLNAFALPNGSIYVHTGMLARMDGEAELAIVLAHEMTHATHRHAIRELRDVRNKRAFGSGLDAILPGLGTLGAMASVSGYSREMETEADEVGFRRAAAAGYDVRRASDLFVKLQEDLREEKRSEPFFFGSHPALAARIENFRRLEKDAGEGSNDTAGFLARTRALVYDNALLDLQRGRTAAARRGAEKVSALEPASPRAAFLRGEIARQRSDAEAALASYRHAIELDANFAAAWRPLGLLLMKRGEKAAAREALQKYLSLAPSAPDRGFVENDLEGLR